MEAPTIIKMEQEIEREMLIDAGEEIESEGIHLENFQDNCDICYYCNRINLGSFKLFETNIYLNEGFRISLL